MANEKKATSDAPEQLTTTPTQDAWNLLYAAINKCSQSGVNSIAVADLKAQAVAVNALINP